MKLNRLLIALFVPALLHAGCTSDDAEDSNTIQNDERRSAIGKADHVTGSCDDVASCGGQASNGSCYCDAQCASYGDCCEDAAEICEVDECTDAGKGCHDGDSCEVASVIMCVTTPCPQPPNTCQAAPPACGGFAGLTCPDGQICVDDPADDCDPANGGADCGGICTPDDGGDDDREPASGQCVRNGNDACETDADCSTGGCGGELCFNPANGGGFTTCDCFTPSGVGGCGCVAGKCTWYN